MSERKFYSFSKDKKPIVKKEWEPTPEMKIRQEEKKKLIEEKYTPVRGDVFEKFIRDLLKKGKASDADIDKWIVHIRLFEQAFTHSSYNSQWNYEAFEFRGDSIVNFCTVDYLIQRFPDLMADDGSGVSTLARLKINMISKAVFAKCAESLGFVNHIASISMR